MQMNGLSLESFFDTNGYANVDVAPGWDRYKICGRGVEEDPWRFGDAMAIRSSFAALTNLAMTTYGFRSNCSKEAALRGEKTFSIPDYMGCCRVEVVWELPVPPSDRDLTFQAQFFVHHDVREEEINRALQSMVLERSIIIHYQEVGPSRSFCRCLGPLVPVSSSMPFAPPTSSHPPTKHFLPHLPFSDPDLPAPCIRTSPSRSCPASVTTICNQSFCLLLLPS